VTRNVFHTDKGANSLPANLVPPDFAAIGKMRLEHVAAMRTELFDELQQMNRIWLDCIQSEADPASEFSTELTAARSTPETAMAYQKWATGHMGIAAEDTKRLLAEGQNVIEAGARLLSNDRLAVGRKVDTSLAEMRP
jgi:hypothetical protein